MIGGEKTDFIQQYEIKDNTAEYKSSFIWVKVYVVCQCISFYIAFHRDIPFSEQQQVIETLRERDRERVILKESEREGNIEREKGRERESDIAILKENKRDREREREREGDIERGLVVYILVPSYFALGNVCQYSIFFVSFWVFSIILESRLN